MRYNFFVFISLISITANTQKLLPTPRNIQATYDKGTRSITGKPGKNYWQNTADYDLDIQFDPVTRLLSGTVNINYVNNSPDTLGQIWFKLYPNLYKSGSPRQPAISPEDVTEGVSIDSMWMNNQVVTVPYKYFWYKHDLWQELQAAAGAIGSIPHQVSLYTQ